MYEELRKSRPDYYSKVEMLISFYFRSLAPALKEVMKAGKKATDSMIELRRLANGPKEAILAERQVLNNAASEFTTHIGSLKGKILNWGQELKILPNED